TVRATSQADTTKSATATVTLLPPVSVTVSPVSATLYGAQTQQFSATVRVSQSAGPPVRVSRLVEPPVLVSQLVEPPVQVP
ncbi:MAG TPA: hypothetical protein VKE70_10940, partial [Candidatus Solibacter sp.]|nr:hypothetical protein [Candidatus Solibacter sp.]